MKDEKLKEILKIYAKDSETSEIGSRVMDIADSVFDRMDRKRSVSLFLYRFAGAAAVVLIAMAIGFSAFFKDHDPAQDAEKSLAVADEEVVDREEGETPVEDEKINKIISLQNGESLAESDFRIKSDGVSELLQVAATHFFLKKGGVSVDVRSGTDFVIEVEDLAIVRVLGTSFSLKTDGSRSLFVKVSEGLVEVVQRGDGSVSALSKGEELALGGYSPKIPAKRQPKVRVEPKPVVAEASKVEENVAAVTPAEIKKPSKYDSIAQLDSEEMMRVTIRDLEQRLLASKSRTDDLSQLFELYSKRGDWGSIMNQWRRYYSEITSKNNSHRQQMHYFACEASIKLFLYGNGVCRKFRSFYPDAAGPEGLEDHLKYAE